MIYIFLMEDGGKDDKTNMSRAALSTHTKTRFWACARALLRPRIPITWI